ncbi:helicase domain protein [Lasius niger]|uniref:Helicase domain protein n=1 Tax=Lasius niger TaxID=67767 RepID=A0A0J7KIA0_LASNI|nr:helicase domain protein [Lasius niger]
MNRSSSELVRVELNHDIIPWSPIGCGDNNIQTPQSYGRDRRFNTTRDRLLQDLHEVSLPEIRERALDVLASLINDRRIVHNYDVHSEILMVMECVDNLFLAADKMMLSRNYLLARIRDQERLSSAHTHELISSSLVLRDPLFDLTSLSISRFYGSPSVLRGDDDLESIRSNLSRFGTSLDQPLKKETNVNSDQDLIRIEKVQEKIDRINAEIASKNASLQILDVATGTALGDLVSDVKLETDRRVGRTRRRGEASHPRGGPPRTRSPAMNNMDMEKESEKLIPPQGIRTPSARRESPTIPGTLLSPSCVGPVLSLPTGEGHKLATVETEPDRDPLDLTFVDCPSMLEEVLQAPP